MGGFVQSINADELGTLLTLGAAALGSLLVIMVNCIHGSRCKRIRCCGIECDREVKKEGEEDQAEGEEAVDGANP